MECLSKRRIAAKWIPKKSPNRLNGRDNQTLMHQQIKMFLFSLVVSFIQFVESMKPLPKARRLSPPVSPCAARANNTAFSCSVIEKHFNITFVPLHYMERHLFWRPSVSLGFLFHRASSCSKRSLKTQQKNSVCPAKDQRSHDDSSQCQLAPSQTRSLWFSYRVSESFTLM